MGDRDRRQTHVIVGFMGGFWFGGLIEWFRGLVEWFWFGGLVNFVVSELYIVDSIL